MRAFTTDDGTARLLRHLGRPAALRLNDFLRRCDEPVRRDPTLTETFQAIEFIGRDDIVEMKLEHGPKIGGRIVATTTLTSGAIWRLGQLRIPGTTLPDAVRNAVRGRPLEEIVEGAPFTGYTVTGAVQDAGRMGALRISCTAGSDERIEIDADAAPRHDALHLETALAVHATTPLDPLAAHVMRLMPREEAVLTLLRLAQAKPGTQVELPMEYRDLVEANPPPHLSTVHRDEPDDYDRIGMMRMKRVKSGYQVECRVARRRDALRCIIENGFVHVPDETKPRTIRDVLGFDIPGAGICGQTKWLYRDLKGYRMMAADTVGSVMEIAA